MTVSHARPKPYTKLDILVSMPKTPLIEGRIIQRNDHQHCIAVCLSWLSMEIMITHLPAVLSFLALTAGICESSVASATKESGYKSYLINRWKDCQDRLARALY